MDCEFFIGQVGNGEHHTHLYYIRANIETTVPSIMIFIPLDGITTNPEFRKLNSYGGVHHFAILVHTLGVQHPGAHTGRVIKSAVS